jgi:membrane-bound ClpP family serine protease
MLVLAAGTSTAQNPPAGGGLFISVPSPITSDAVNRIKNQVEKARTSPTRPVSTIVFDFTPDGREAATSGYGVARDLAMLIADLHGLKTVGFVSANVSGHTILPLLACKEVVMSRSAQIGPIVRPGEPFTPDMQAGYDLILGASREPLRAVVRKMADPEVELVRGQKDGGEWFVDRRNRDAFEQDGGTIPDPNPLPFAMRGMAGQFNFEQSRQLGLVRRSAESRQDLATELGLPPSALKEDPLDGRAPVAFRYVMRGYVDNGVKEATRRVIQDVTRQGGNLLFVQIECGEGDLSAARDIADDFQRAQQNGSLLVVGFVPEPATPAGSVIAFGCGEIVLSRRADLGEDALEADICDFSPVLDRNDPGTVEFLRKNLKELATLHGISDVLIDGMLDPELVIVRAQARNDPTRIRLMSQQEYDAVKAEWQSAGIIKHQGQLLKLDATTAANLGITRTTVNSRDINEVYAYYGIDVGQVIEATPGWLDRFSTFLRLPAVTVLLVVIGFAGLILELKVPGITVPGIIAALCFILIFWAHTGVNGNAAILGGMIFLLGLVLILIEVFVLPGFGAPGILGILFMLGGIGLATLDRIPHTGEEWTEFGGKVGIYMLAMLGALVLAIAAARFLPHVPYANRMMLAPPDEQPDAGGSELPGAALAASLLGAVGTAATMLRPAGMAQFGDQYVDVVTEGGFIAAGARIQVVEVEGTRIVVREV